MLVSWPLIPSNRVFGQHIIINNLCCVVAGNGILAERLYTDCRSAYRKFKWSLKHIIYVVTQDYEGKKSAFIE